MLTSTRLLGPGLLMMMLSLLTNCSKSDTPAPSRPSLLTSHNWRVSGDITTVSSKGANQTIDNYKTYNSCRSDDFYVFGVDHTYIEDEAASNCDASGPQTRREVWSFSEDEEEIIISNRSIYRIQELTATKLVLVSEIKTLDTTYVYTKTYAAI